MKSHKQFGKVLIALQRTIMHQFMLTFSDPFSSRKNRTSTKENRDEGNRNALAESMSLSSGQANTGYRKLKGHDAKERVS